MHDRDGDLVHLFVRDLDDIDLPARERWQPTPRRESALMRTGRYLLYAGATAVVLVVALIAGFGLRDRNTAAVPSPTASSAAPATTMPGVVSASPGATASATSSAAPSPASGRHTSILGYAIEMPAPWHRSSCSTLTQQSEPIGEVFVPVSVHDEGGSDVGSPYTTLGITAEQNPRNLTARQWADQDPSGFAGQRVEDTTYAGKPAARKTIPGTSLATYYVANADRMYVVRPIVRDPLDAATEQTLTRIIGSFRFISEDERAAARAALPTAAPPRTPEQVADGVAAAFAAKDVSALAGYLSPCVATAGENAGGTSVSREKYLEDLRAAFAAGLAVTVQPRPLEGDRSTGNVTIASTWQDSRGTKDRKLMLRRGENDRWEWQGTIERYQ